MIWRPDVALAAAGILMMLVIVHVQRARKMAGLLDVMQSTIFTQAMQMKVEYDLYGAVIDAAGAALIADWIAGLLIKDQVISIVSAVLLAIIWVAMAVMTYRRMMRVLQRTTDLVEIQRQQRIAIWVIGNIVICSLLFAMIVAWLTGFSMDPFARTSAFFFLGFIELIAALNMFQLQRLHIEMPPLPTEPSPAKRLELHPEPALAAIFGINTLEGVWLKREFFTLAHSPKPQNTLVCTDRRILILFIPMPGMDAIIGEQNYPVQNFEFNRPLIETNARTLFDRMTLDEVVAMSEKNIQIPYENIVACSMDTQMRSIHIQTADGFDQKYLYLDPAAGPPVRDVLVKYLGSRMTT